VDEKKEDQPKPYRVASGRNAQELEDSLNDLSAKGYHALVGLDAPNQTPLVVMVASPDWRPSTTEKH
jgi:hypothetical protein